MNENKIVDQGKWQYYQIVEAEITRAAGWPRSVAPTVSMINAGENAWAVLVVGSKNNGPNWETALIDEVWLDSLTRKADGSKWIRYALLAHELGHMYLGHPVGQGPNKQWQREYDADVFAGKVLCKLGASLSETQAIYPYIAITQEKEDEGSHPSLGYRRRASEEGWRQGGCFTEGRLQVPSGEGSTLIPPSEERLRARLQGFAFLDAGAATIFEARSILERIGVSEISDRFVREGLTGSLGADWEVSIWPGTYGKTRCYGLRYGRSSNRSYVGSNATYLELCK
jgi:hypothetical protein